MQDAHAFLTSLTVAGERLRVGDVLAVAGTHEAIEAAQTALVGSEPPQRSSCDTV